MTILLNEFSPFPRKKTYIEFAYPEGDNSLKRVLSISTESGKTVDILLEVTILLNEFSPFPQQRTGGKKSKMEVTILLNEFSPFPQIWGRRH